MLLPSCITALSACIPCLEIDELFMKHPTYNEGCIMVISKTKDLQMQEIINCRVNKNQQKI
jgi:hypothetical protein